MEFLLLAYLVFLLLLYIFISFFAILQVIRFGITNTLVTFLVTLYVVGTLTSLLLAALVSI
jgi:hypothetical protein